MNYLNLTLGGDKRGLKFNNRTIELIGTITNADPLTFAPASQAWPDLFKYVCVIVTAAMNSNQVSKKVDDFFNLDDVTEWMQDTSPAEIYLVMNIWREFMNPQVSVNGEVNADTQGNVAGR